MFLLLSLLSGACASVERAQVQLIRTTFNHGRDVTTSGGTLISLQATSAVISKMSIVSRVKGSLSLLESVDSSVLVRKCAFEGLASYFGHFSGGSVAVMSSSFADSARPLTFEKTLGASAMHMGFGSHAQVWECSRTYSGYGPWRLSSTAFSGCPGEGTAPGGAVYYERHPYSGDAWTPALTIKDSDFDNCRAGNRWGDAIYSTADMSTFEFDGCTFLNFADSRSVAHFQWGIAGVPGDFGNLRFTNNKFKTVSTIETQGGGSGLVVRFPTQLELVDWVFETCSITTTGGALMFDKGTNFVFNGCNFSQTKANTKGGAIALTSPDEYTVSIIGCLFQGSNQENAQAESGGFLYFAGSPNLEITDTTFKDGVAGDGGCIYAATNKVASFTIDNVTVDTCGSRTGRYSVVVQSKITTLSGLRMLNMPGSYGKLKLHSEIPEVVFSGCEFVNFGTDRLFDGPTLGLTVNLTDCTFQELKVPEENFLRFTNDGAYEMVMTRCVFKDVTAQWAMISWSIDAPSVKCIVEDCHFDNVVVNSQNTAKAEPVLSLRRISGVSLTNVTFTNSALKNGPIAIGASGCRITLDLVHFENCNIARPGSQPIQGDPHYPCLDISGGIIEKMNACTFVLCTYDTGDQPLLNIDASVTIQSPVSVSFDRCGTTTPNLVSFGPSGSHTFTACTFKNMDLTAAVVRFGSSTSTELIFEDVVFYRVMITEQTTNLLGFAQPPTKLEFDNVRVQSCKFAKLGDIQEANLSIRDSEFRDSTVHSNMLDSKGTSVEFWDCDFSDCTCESSIMRLSGCTTVNISLTSFTDCSCNSGALVTITDAVSVFMSSSCFQGLAEPVDGPGYINCTCEVATFELPMCFSLLEEASISFQGCPSPFLNISDPSALFNCSNCSFLPSDEPDYSDDVTMVDDPTTPPESEGGLSGGAIAGIVIGVLLFIGIIIALVIILVLVIRRRDDEEKTLEDNPSEMDEEPTTTSTITSVVSEWDQRVTEEGALTTETANFTNDLGDNAFMTFEEAFD